MPRVSNARKAAAVPGLECTFCHTAVYVTSDELREVLDAGNVVRCGRHRWTKIKKPPPRRRSSKVDLVVRFLLDARRDGVDVMTVAEIAVGVWRRHPETFGLEGFESQHPDKNTVLVTLLDARGRGIVDRPTPGRYAAAGNTTAREGTP